jgi:TP901-1 family phage major tail protein
MAASAGRDFLMKLGSGSPLSYTTIAAARENSLTVNGTEVDVTTMDSDGVRTLLAGAGVSSYEASISGIFTDAAGQASLESACAARTFVNLSLENATNTITTRGQFQVTSFTRAGSEGDTMTFNATLVSAGAETTTNS